MGDFTDKMAMGTSRMNPSSMVPGAMGGNAPQNGMTSQMKSLASQLQNGGGGVVPRLKMPPNPRAAAPTPQAAAPTPQKMSELPPEMQQMLPNKSEKSKTYKKEDFGLLADVFKTLSER